MRKCPLTKNSKLCVVSPDFFDTRLFHEPSDCSSQLKILRSWTYLKPISGISYVLLQYIRPVPSSSRITSKLQQTFDLSVFVIFCWNLKLSLLPSWITFAFFSYIISKLLVIRTAKSIHFEFKQKVVIQIIAFQVNIKFIDSKNKFHYWKLEPSKQPSNWNSANFRREEEVATVAVQHLPRTSLVSIDDIWW